MAFLFPNRLSEFSILIRDDSHVILIHMRDPTRGPAAVRKLQYPCASNILRTTKVGMHVARHPGQLQEEEAAGGQVSPSLQCLDPSSWHAWGWGVGVRAATNSWALALPQNVCLEDLEAIPGRGVLSPPAAPSSGSSRHRAGGPAFLPSLDSVHCGTGGGGGGYILRPDLFASAAKDSMPMTSGLVGG